MEWWARPTDIWEVVQHRSGGDVARTSRANSVPSTGPGQRTTIVAGLAFASCVLVWPRLANVASYLDRLGQAYGLQPLSAVAVLCVLYAVYQRTKRHREQSRARDADAEAHVATRRIGELERLVAFGGALLRARDQDSIRAVTQEHLPALVPLAPQGAAPSASGLEPVRASHDADPQMLQGARDLLTAALQNSESFQQVYENSRQDALTGCFNRTHALETLGSEIRRASRAGSTLSLVMFDLDHFKAINDRFGHLCGDEVLAAIGVRIKASTRTSDVKCRYGGEEFLVILPETPLAGARQVAENLRRVIADDPVPWSVGAIGVTASFGVTHVAAGEIDPMAVLARSDLAMYQAKRQGRNCVVVAVAEGEAVAAGEPSAPGIGAPAPALTMAS
jgi:diguanylate cyclase (GGDEF)-like protein